MKAVTQGIARAPELGLKHDMYRLAKPKMDEGEMAACFMKLKELVPTIPHHRKISKTQLLQHVIDYICDLEVALEVPSSPSSVFTSPVQRAPLSEKSQPNAMVDEVFEAMAEDSDCERPVSK